MQETWKSVIGYEGIYEVSNNGKVRSVDRIGKRTFNTERKLKWKELSLGNCKGYRIVRMGNDGGIRTEKVHRLVAEAFLPKVEGKTFVNHKNSNRSDNRVENLEWCNSVENNTHRHLKTKTSSRFTGVYYKPKLAAWQATGRVNGKNIHLGTFKTDKEAYSAKLDFNKKNRVVNKYVQP